MTGPTFVALVIGAVAGGAVAATVAPPRLRRPPAKLIRRNFRGASVPAVLGEAVVMAGLVGIGVMAIMSAGGWSPAPGTKMSSSVALLLIVMGVAGLWDDLRGNELPRGFRGHLGALKTLRLTGGMVKLLAGGVVGIGVGLVLSGGTLSTAVEVGLLVALMANTINLLDRAPGRAAKFSLVVFLPLAAFGSAGWAAGVAGTFGGLTVVTRDDLLERGMLGDAGANPVGALLGLGLAVSLPSFWRWVAIALLVALNLASERWSFSDAIRRTPVLHRLDMAGRRPLTEEREGNPPVNPDA